LELQEETGSADTDADVDVAEDNLDIACGALVEARLAKTGEA
jgi:hypothetical protein